VQEEELVLLEVMVDQLVVMVEQEQHLQLLVLQLQEEEEVVVELFVLLKVQVEQVVVHLLYNIVQDKVVMQDQLILAVVVEV